MIVDLPPEVWRVLHGMMLDDAIPRRAQFQAMSAFEVALKAAQDAQLNQAHDMPASSDAQS